MYQRGLGSGEAVKLIHSCNPRPFRRGAWGFGHPIDGWELTVLRSYALANGQSQLRVELPIGRERAMPA